jgi:hypothetical protein
MTSTRSTLLVFALASLLTVACGALVMTNNGLDPAMWSRNLIAWVAGAGLAALISRFTPSNKCMLPVAIGLLAITFLMHGQSGVYRWFGVGPVRINAAALILPIAITSLRRDRFSLLLVVVFLLLFLQPDASQATALAVSAALFAMMTPLSLRARLMVWFVVALWAGLSWLQPDPLLPVAHVEGIVGLAWVQSPLQATVMISALIITALSPLLMWTDPAKRAVALALAGYFSASGLTAAFGAFPVPLAGYGVSFVLGWWLAMGSLLDKKRPQKRSESVLHP